MRPRPSGVPDDLSISAELRDYLSKLEVAATPRGNNAATAAPTANDDIEAGYDVRGLWFDLTNDALYACLDNTAGAAVWKKLSP